MQRQIERANELLKNRPLKSDAYSAWFNTTREFLVKAFGSNSPNVGSVLDIGRYESHPMNAGELYWENHRVKTLNGQLTMLASLVELLQTEAELQSGGQKQPHIAAPHGNRVFLVHGRNESALQSVARFIEKLQLPVTILHEQPNEGRTVIEKFVEYSDVAFAVVLLTGDDRGGLSETSYEAQLPRARQNVILELGFFLGKLGRRRVCALYEQAVEIPSDYAGVLFVKLDDAGAWRLTLARELKAANLPIDMNKAV